MVSPLLQASLRELFKVEKDEPQDLMLLPPSSTPSGQQTPSTEQEQPLSQKQIEEVQHPFGFFSLYSDCYEHTLIPLLPTTHLCSC